MISEKTDTDKKKQSGEMMEIKFSCSNKDCNYEGSEDYVMCIPSEAVADENNMAAVFCPHCAKELCKPELCKPIDAVES